MKHYAGYPAATMVLLVLTSAALAQSGDPKRGAGVFRTCAACHSLETDRNMTGPSLADLWNRKAGGLSSFPRYSPPIKSAGIVWDDKTLDEWVKDPARFIPGNAMTFPGIKEAQPRADLLAFLKQATKPGATRAQSEQAEGGMMGMGGGAVQSLKTLNPEDRVQAITHCGDTYKVTTADGKTRDFWERNLRFKTDVSDDGPEKGAPAIVPAGMLGDRANVIFAAPEEISGFISNHC